MSEFVIAIPADGAQQGPPSALDPIIEGISTLGADVFGARAHEIDPAAHGVRALVLDEEPFPLIVASSPRGLLLLKGVLIPETSTAPLLAGSPEASSLLEASLRDPQVAFRACEGCFAAFVWDSEKQAGYAVNDTAACLNLYTGTFGGVHWVATAALLLARVLRLPLDPGAVMELLGRGAVLAPASLFDGLRRIGVGEAATIGARCGIRVTREWVPFAEIAHRRNAREAAARIGDRLVNRLEHLGKLPRPLVADLTGGYDTRVVCSAAHAAGMALSATVNGPQDDPDVGIARSLAQRLDWPFLHFDPTSLWSIPIDEAMQRRLLYRTSGELPYTAIYHQLLTRPLLAQSCAAHLNGIMGELQRSAPWSQEFGSIGRSRPASIERLLRYRFLQGGPPPPGLYNSNWHPGLVARLGAWAREIASQGPATQTNQQCDAIFIWKMTGHVSLYTTAAFGWLPTIAPLAFTSLMSESLSVPWRLKLTSDLQRRIIAHLSPTAACAPTVYGSHARPLSIWRLDREALQAARQARVLVSKLDRVYLGGHVSRSMGWRATPWPASPFLTGDFRQLMRGPGDAMLSRAIYRPEGLTAVLEGPNEVLQAREKLLTRMATVELLCREVQQELDARFLG
jgi:hypothetical protein